MNEFSLAIKDFFEKRGVKQKKELNIEEELEKASKNASKIQVVSHVMKFTHSGSDGSNFLSDNDFLDVDKEMQHYISTQSLTHKKYDFSGGAALLPTFELLMIEHNGETLRNRLLQGDSSPVAPFAQSEKQLKIWMEGFTKTAQVKHFSAHRSKQIYFPVSKGEYHLLAPVFSSALCQFYQQCIKQKRDGEEAKNARKNRKNNTFSEHKETVFKKLAVIRFGGSQPQNVSSLNLKRGGKAFLFNAEPPTWRTQENPPKTAEVFWRNFERKSRKLFEKYAAFLSINKDKNNFEVRDQSQGFRKGILEILFDYVDQISLMEPGWSKDKDCKLEDAYKLWLDPFDNSTEETASLEHVSELLSKEFSIRFSASIGRLSLELDESNRQILKKEFLHELKKRSGL